MGVRVSSRGAERGPDTRRRPARAARAWGRLVAGSLETPGNGREEGRDAGGGGGREGRGV